MSRHLSTPRHTRGLVASFAAVAIGITGLVALATSASATQNDPPAMPNVTFCHWDNGQGGRWNDNTTDPNSIIRTGHGDHGNDIIPAFTWYEQVGTGHDKTWEARQFAGLNLSSTFGWGATGAQVLANGCALPNEPATPVTPTAPVFTPPTCDIAGTFEGVPTGQYSWTPSGPLGAKTLTAVAIGNVTLTGPTVFGPHDLTQLSGDACLGEQPGDVPVAPAVYTAPTCQAAGTLVGVDTEDYEWIESGFPTAAKLTATPISEVTLTGQTVFGPYDLTKLTGAACLSETPVIPQTPVVPAAPTVVKQATLAETGFPLLGALGLAGSFSLIGGGLVNARRLLRKSA